MGRIILWPLAASTSSDNTRRAAEQARACVPKTKKRQRGRAVALMLNRLEFLFLK